MFLFPATDKVIGRALELYGEFAESENRVMAQLVKPGDTAVDVGANLGTVTVPLALRVGPTGRVFAFEPQRMVYQCLSATLALNGIGNVEAFRLGVGAKEGTARLALPRGGQKMNLGAARLVREGAGEAVRVIALDSLALRSCALIKIDVEGMEAAVLAGAGDTVARTRPAIYAEAKKGPGTETVIQWLAEREYGLYWHFAGFVEADNFRGREGDVFSGGVAGKGRRGDINLLALPRERKLAPQLPRIAGPKSDWAADYAAWSEARKAKA